MKTKLAVIILVLFVCSKFNTQQINILNIEKIEKYNPYLIIYCELVNDTNFEIVLPLQFDGKNTYDYILNDYSSYYQINSKPKNIFQKFEIPPPSVGADFLKLGKDNLIICPAYSSKTFSINSSKIGGGIYFKNSANLKAIQIVYFPFTVEYKEKYLEENIRQIKFYDKKIISKYFKLKKKK